VGPLWARETYLAGQGMGFLQALEYQMQQGLSSSAQDILYGEGGGYGEGGVI